MTDKPIWEQATDTNPAYRFFRGRHRQNKALTLTLNGHILVEFLLNEIIRRHCKCPRQLLDDHRSYTFAIKLQLLYAMHVLTDDLYKNIRKLNAIRNYFAHHMDGPHDSLDFIGYERGNAVDLRRYCRQTKHPECEYIELLCHVILTEVTQVFVTLFKEPPPIPIKDNRENAH